MEDRKYIAISIKHSAGVRFTLWGQKRTEDHEKRCFQATWEQWILTSANFTV